MPDKKKCLVAAAVAQIFTFILAIAGADSTSWFVRTTTTEHVKFTVNSINNNTLAGADVIQTETVGIFRQCRSVTYKDLTGEACQAKKEDSHPDYTVCVGILGSNDGWEDSCGFEYTAEYGRLFLTDGDIDDCDEAIGTAKALCDVEFKKRSRLRAAQAFAVLCTLCLCVATLIVVPYSIHFWRLRREQPHYKASPTMINAVCTLGAVGIFCSWVTLGIMMGSCPCPSAGGSQNLGWNVPECHSISPKSVEQQCGKATGGDQWCIMFGESKSCHKQDEQNDLKTTVSQGSGNAMAVFIFAGFVEIFAVCAVWCCVSRTSIPSERPLEGDNDFDDEIVAGIAMGVRNPMAPRGDGRGGGGGVAEVVDLEENQEDDDDVQNGFRVDETDVIMT